MGIGDFFCFIIVWLDLLLVCTVDVPVDCEFYVEYRSRTFGLITGFISQPLFLSTFVLSEAP